LDDVYNAQLLILAGQNPGSNHPRMLSALEKAKRCGAKIIAINPLREAGLINFRNPQTPRGCVGKGTDLTDLHLADQDQWRPGPLPGVGRTAAGVGRS
jgi:formate dehydrogenase major subunit